MTRVSRLAVSSPSLGAFITAVVLLPGLFLVSSQAGGPSSAGIPGPIVPPAFATVEDQDGQAGTLRDVIRLQNVYDKSHFTSGPMVISGIAYRPDAGSTPFTNMVASLRVVLSTTTNAPGTLSSTFAQNYGPDIMVVREGPIQLSSQVTGPSSGPHAFDIVIPFQRPFLYSPAVGHLLVEVVSSGSAIVSRVDASNESNDGASRVFAFGGSSQASGSADTGADIIQLLLEIKPGLSIWPIPPRTFSNPLDVTLWCSFPESQITYTTDASEPTLASQPYEHGILLTNTTVLLARAFTNGVHATEIVRGEFTYQPEPPSITSQPASKTVTEGSQVTLSVTASGTSPLTYQWLYKGVEIEGRTNSSLTLTLIKQDQAGEYAVRVSNIAGTKTSDPATLTVTPAPVAPTIVEDLQDQTALVGTTVVLKVVAQGTAPLSYRWYKNGTALTPPSPNNTLTLSNVQLSNAGNYKARVSNIKGFVDSRTAKLTVIDQPLPPEITSTPQHQWVPVGASVTLNVTATGTAPLAYQWRRNGVDVPGATNSTLVLENVQPAQAGTYTTIVSNAGGSKTSSGSVVDVCAEARGGSVVFDNHTGAIDAPVFGPDGTTKIEGSAFLAQLYAGVSADTLAPVGAAVPFRTGASAGYFSSGANPVRVITAVEPGAAAAIEIRAWEAARGASYEEALRNAGLVGRSQTLVVTTGGAGEPPSFPVELTGLASFSLAREAIPPTITIATPVAGVTHDERVVLMGTIVDNGIVAPASVRWEWDGRAMGSLALNDAGQFASTPVRLHRGENRMRVMAADLAGNEAAAEVVATWEPSRILSLVSEAEQQEGRRLAIAVSLASEGDVSGMSFLVRYDPERLIDPELVWSETVASGIGQVNLETPGEVRATLALPATAVPAGSQLIAGLSLRARSVPSPTTTELRVEVLDVADTLGNKIVFGTDTSPGTATIVPRKVKGDNNGNDRLDIGDASVVQRFVAALETLHPWDITGNDLNESQDLDSGDVIKVLRAVIGLDPQPEGAVPVTPTSTVPGRTRSAHVGLQGQGEAGASSEEGCTFTIDLPNLEPIAPILPPGPATMTASHRTLVPGSKVVVQVHVPAIMTIANVSGASFVLRYPVEALRLANETAHRPGPMVPAETMTMWGVKPGYADQTGEVSVAFTSPLSWPAASGVLAELTFDVQAGAAAQPEWRLQLMQVELATQRGYEIERLWALPLTLGSALPRLSTEVQRVDNAWRVLCTGAAGVTYTLEASADLVHWQAVTQAVNAAGTTEFMDPAPASSPVRFYRVREGGM